MKSLFLTRAVVSSCLVAVAACSGPDSVTSPDLRIAAGKATTTTTTGPVVNSTTPSSSVRNVTLDVHIFGSGFDRGSNAQWAIKGVPTSKVTTNSTTYVSSKELIANITIASDADVAYYDVVVTASSGKPGIGTETFEIVVQTTDLGTLGGGDAEAMAINDVGQIAGGSTTSRGVNTPFLWTDGVMRNLGMPAGGTWGRAEGLNNTGTVVGEAAVNGIFKPFLWTESTGMLILPLPLGVATGYASDVNDAGAVVGLAGESTTGHAVIWKNGAIVDIHPSPGGSSDAFSINTAGDVVGVYRPASGGAEVPFLRTAAGEVRWLPCPTGGQCSAASINADGDVAGHVYFATDASTYAYRWYGSGLGAHGIIGEKGTTASSISDGGFVSGAFRFTIWANNGAALWGGDGVMVPLQAESKSIPASGGGTAVNSSGWVVGFTEKNVKGRLVHRAVRWRLPLA